MCKKKKGFSSTPYLESCIPTFGLGTPAFQIISLNLHCGTPTFSKRCFLDSYVLNLSDNSESLISLLTWLCSKLLKLPGPKVIKLFFILNAHKYENIKKFSFYQARVSLEYYFFCS